MMMNLHKSHMLRLSLIVSLLAIAPLLSSSMRGTFLYFIFNLLVVALGVEAGILSSSPSNNSSGYDMKYAATVLVVEVPQISTEILEGHALVLLKAATLAERAKESLAEQLKVIAQKKSEVVTLAERAKESLTEQLMVISQKKSEVVKICSPVKIVSTVVTVLKKPSIPSLFFIGEGETEADELELSHHNDHYSDDSDDEVEEFDEEAVGGQELYDRTEIFIGNFYKQLKMQREKSWSRIHGFHKKAIKT